MYTQTTGVDSVITVIDGRMDGGQPWSPDLSKLNTSQIEAWADEAADVYCSVDAVGGIQVDLEPFSGKYVVPLLTFVARLASNLRSAERNCVSASHPSGRSITMFMFASVATPAVWQALGTNGFVTVSGYDLSAAPPGTPSDVSYYTTQLAAAAAEIAASATAAGNASFFVGIPAAASTHEFHTFTWANGTVVQGHPQVRAALPVRARLLLVAGARQSPTPPRCVHYQTEFVAAALEVLKNASTSGGTYLGTALWGFSSEMDCEATSRSAMPSSCGSTFSLVNHPHVQTRPTRRSISTRRIHLWKRGKRRSLRQICDSR